MAFDVIGNCNTLPMIQGVIQNCGGSPDIRETPDNFDMALEIRECVWGTKAVETVEAPTQLWDWRFYVKHV
jgi:hypothetical protein